MLHLNLRIVIIDVIRTLNVDKPHRRGNILIRILKTFDSVTVEPYSIIFNCINQCMRPNILKKLNICPICSQKRHKKTALVLEMRWGQC